MKSKNRLTDYGRYTGISVQMLVVIAGGVFAGFKLDKYIDLKFPVFTVVLSLLSVVFAIYIVIKDLLKKQ